ncbi:putative hexapeptide repeat containing transferase like protein [Bacillus phage phiAGATE]|uniref:Hexapeptide repeat containing transferase like protein n=1 Tax=Bacillus phage phiAGATE TaxID=1204533 RepID=L0LC68_9CAUD|nr:putative hexapeptide repeat containing transferase like protein [Bacillus phage phiAGATE]AGB62681.1 putative hexapeptide repeat containing transferase like protein [Bacillus phage phiAGATE]
MSKKLTLKTKVRFEFVIDYLGSEEELTMENAEQQKYILLEGDTLVAPNGSTLYRIQAVRDFSNVFEGDLGGYIQQEDNLSHTGDCWVYGNAKVYDDAQVLGNARVHSNVRVRDAAVVDENAVVYDNAKILGYAVVTGSAHVSRNAVVSGSANVRDFSTARGYAKIQGKAKIEDHAIISGDAEVRGAASIRLSARLDGQATVDDRACITRPSDVLVIHPIGSNNGTLTAYLDRDGEVLCNRGCFNGTLEQFSEAVEKSHKYLNPSVFEEYQLAIKLIEQRLLKLK